jgi:hypothetical protein
MACKNSMEQKIKKEIYLQIERYPKSTLQDIYKNFYQDNFGTEHAIPNKEAVEDYLMHELSNMQIVDNDAIVENIGWQHNFVRVPLSLVKNGKIPVNELLQAFIESATAIDANATDTWIDEWNKIVEIIETMSLNISGFDEDKEKIAELLNKNPKMALHHSEIFNSTYRPHYRVVEKTVYKNRLEKFLK